MKLLTRGMLMISLVSSLFGHSMEVNAQSASEQIKLLKPANADCQLLREKIQGLKTKDLDKVLQLLDEIKSPSQKDIDIMLSALKTDLEDNLNSYMKLAISNCPMAHYNLAQLIFDFINDKKPTPADRKLALDRLKTSVFSATHYPVLITAAINASILESGVEKGIWLLPEASLKTLKETRVSLLAYNKTMEPKFNELHKLLEERGNSPKGLKKHKRFQELRGLFIEEATKAKEYLDRLKGFAEELSYRS